MPILSVHKDFPRRETSSQVQVLNKEGLQDVLQQSPIIPLTLCSHFIWPHGLGHGLFKDDAAG